MNRLAFLDPGLLWLAAAAAAVPLAAHFVARTRPPEQTLPTLEFLRRAVKRVWRLRRPRDLLLLLLRTLAIAALGLAFARPLWLSGLEVAGASEAKHLVLVVDRSGSMGAVAGGQSRFALAKARAVEALRGAGRLESVNLVWIDAAPSALFPAMGRAAAPLESALSESEVTGEAGDAAAAIRLALERLAPLEGSKELVVVSDFQGGTWSGRLPELPATVRALALAVGEDADNLAIASLEIEPAAPLPGETVQVFGRLRNFGAEPRSARVAVTLGDSRQVREIEIAPWGEGQFILEAPAPEGAEEFLVRAALEGGADALRGDDSRAAGGRVREALKVALLLPPGTVSETEAEIWSRLVRSLPWLREVEEASSADAIVAAGAGPALLAELETALARGAAVVYRTSAAGSPPGFLENGASGASGAEGGRWETRPADGEGWRLRIPREAESQPLFRLFAEGDYGNPAAGGSHARWRAAGEDGVLMAYDDGVPAILRAAPAAGGVLWWWNLPLDPALASWTLQPAFIPVVGEALLLSRPRQPPPPHLSVAPGARAEWAPAFFPEGGEMVLLDAEGGLLPLAEESGGGLAYRSAGTLQPGVYRWALRDASLERDAVLARTAVNFPESEMDLRALDAAAIESWIDSPSHGGGGRLDWSSLREGVPLWPWFLALALALFAVEGSLLLRRPKLPIAASPRVAA